MSAPYATPHQSPRVMDLPIYLLVSESESDKWQANARLASSLPSPPSPPPSAAAYDAAVTTVEPEPTRTAIKPVWYADTLSSDNDSDRPGNAAACEMVARLYASERHTHTLELALASLNRRSAQDRQRLSREKHALERRVAELERRESALESSLRLCERLVRVDRWDGAAASVSSSLHDPLDRIQSYVRCALDQ